ncbi:MAG: TniB family NTP-binding protein [Blastocatellia bacterium]
MSQESSHLNSRARAILELSDDKRIEYVRSPRWIGYARAKQILEKLDELYTHPKTHRMPNLLIVGDTNNGKTMIVNRFKKLHPHDENREGESIVVPVFVVQAPPTADESRFYEGILEKLSAPYRGTDKPFRKQFQVMSIFEKIGVRILIIDEIHNILAGSLLQQRNFRNALKYLGNELKIPIVGAGTKEAFNALQTDPQLSNRFQPAFLPRWEIGDNKKSEEDPFLQLLASFESILPLRNPSNLVDTTLALKILSMSEGLIGEISAVLISAAIKAIKTKKEIINLKILKEIDFVPPSDRKWQAGR